MVIQKDLLVSVLIGVVAGVALIGGIIYLVLFKIPQLEARIETERVRVDAINSFLNQVIQAQQPKP